MKKMAEKENTSPVHPVFEDRRDSAGFRETGIFFRSLILIVTNLGEAVKAPWGRYICSIHHAGPTTSPYGAWQGGRQICCYKYAALTGLGRFSPKSVIIRKFVIFPNT
ncbi:Uncharacterized protein dnm_053140 [Desulfonema magnum]|uniref:Uncharacterized protein n=1 Tax=Desulfonema magnum TaxID=45655 RepID=A0A975GPW9_9BACT|nr:Uncharacterized protein dnm_053140 [Desulfonema magnum]